MVRLDPQYRLVFGQGGELLATPDPERMEQAIARLAPGDVPGFRRFLEDNRAKFNAFKQCLQTPFLGWRDLLSWRMLKLLPMLRPWASLDRELARYFADPRPFCLPADDGIFTDARERAFTAPVEQTDASNAPGLGSLFNAQNRCQNGSRAAQTVERPALDTSVESEHLPCR